MDLFSSEELRRQRKYSFFPRPSFPKHFFRRKVDLIRNFVFLRGTLFCVLTTPEKKKRKQKQKPFQRRSEERDPRKVLELSLTQGVSGKIANSTSGNKPNFGYIFGKIKKIKITKQKKLIFCVVEHWYSVYSLSLSGDGMCQVAVVVCLQPRKSPERR